MENVQNINEHTDLSNLSEQIKQVSNSIKKDIDFNDVLQKIQDNYEDIIQNVDKQTAGELGKQFTQLQDVLTVVKETSTTNKNQNKTKTENSEKSGGENGK
jgi:hypothetical protein